MIPIWFYLNSCRKNPKIHNGIRKIVRKSNTAKKLLAIQINYISLILNQIYNKP